jgi:O-antigen/teichoic acid export membrane protein
MTVPAPAQPPQTPPKVGAKLSVQVGAVVFGRLIVAIFDGLKAFAIVRLMDKEAYGSLAFTLTVLATATGLGLLAIPDSQLFFLPRLPPARQRTLVRQSLQLLTGLGLVSALVIAALALVPGLQPSSHVGLTLPLLVIAVTVVFEFPSSALTSFLLGVERHRVSSLWTMAVSLASNLSLLVPAALGADLVTLLAVYLLVAIARLAATIGVWQSVYRGVMPEPFPGGMRAQLAFAVPLWLNSVAGQVNKYFSTYVVGFIFTSVVFADYTVGAQELPFIGILSYSVAVAMLPRMSAIASEGDDRTAAARDAIGLWHTGIEKVALVILPIFVFAMAQAEPIIVLLYGKNYAAAALPFRMFLCLLPLRVTAYGTMLMALGHPRAILRSQLAGVIVNTAINFALVAFVMTVGRHAPAGTYDHLGLGWAAFGSVAAQVVIIVVLLRQIATVSQLSMARVFPWVPYRRRFLAAVLAGVVLLPWTTWAVALGGPVPDVGDGLSGMAVGLVVRLVLYAATYLGLAHVFDLLTAADRRYVWAWLKLEPLWRRNA